MNAASPFETAPLAVSSRTTPTRFTVSATEIKRGSIFLSFTRPDTASDDVTVTGITVALPRGAEPTDLVNDEQRGDYNLIDDYPDDSTGAAWSIKRTPEAAVAFAPEWGEAPDHGFQNMFDPSDDRYYQTAGRVPKDSALVVDYGTTQEISTIDIATGRPGGQNKVQMLWLQSSMDGTHWTNLGEHPDQDTAAIRRTYDPPLEARYLRILTIVDPSNENWAVVRRFLINHGGQARSEDPEDSVVTFACTPDDGTAVFDDSRVFTLILANIPINTVAGIAPVTITQTTDTGGVEHKHPDVLEFEKASNEFVFENFSSEQPRVRNGGHVVLRWTGSPENSQYYLSWGTGSEQTERLTVPNATACRFDTADLEKFHGLTQTTTFVLDAQTPSAGQAGHHYQSTTVTVIDPDIEAKALTALDRIIVETGDDDGTDVSFSASSNDQTTRARTADFHGNVTIT